MFSNYKKYLMPIGLVLVLFFLLCFAPVYKYHQVTLGNHELLIRTHVVTGKTQIFNPIEMIWLNHKADDTKNTDQQAEPTQPPEPTGQQKNAADVIRERLIKQSTNADVIKQEIKKLEISISIHERLLNDPSQYASSGDMIILQRKGATEKEINELKIMEIQEKINSLKQQKDELEKRLNELN